MSAIFGRRCPIRPPSLTANVVAALLDDPAVLGLRTRRLLPDIRERFGCCEHVAAEAVSMARQAMQRSVDSRGAIGHIAREVSQ